MAGSGGSGERWRFVAGSGGSGSSGVVWVSSGVWCKGWQMVAGGGGSGKWWPVVTVSGG